MSKVIRGVKNITKGYSQSQIKVREATSNDAWGPTGPQMSEIAHLTYNTSTEFYDIMDMLDKRLNDKGKNWRHVLKALKVLDYCLHEGSELVVTWAKQSIYIIKTLREFQYIDEDGRDVGQNVRVAAKELTSLILDEERLRAERSDRQTWKSRVSGLDENAPPPEEAARRHARARRRSDEDDTEYKLAIEASKHQEEEDRKKRASKVNNDNDDDLAKAIRLSKEEEEARRLRELDQANSSSLFDDEPSQPAQPQYTGFNQGYQQGSAVDFFANPIEQNQFQQQQQTGYMPQAYTGFTQQQTGFQMPQATGYTNPYATNGFGMQNMNTGMDPYGQQTTSPFQAQPTGFNPYAQQQQQQQPQQQQMQMPMQSEPALQPGSNNPWSTNNNSSGLVSQNTAVQLGSDSNNPFGSSFSSRPTTTFNKAPSMTALPEQKTLSTFSPINNNQFGNSQPMPSSSIAPQKEMNEHEAKLNALLSSGDGMDTFGNTGNLRIPAQHTAPGMFINSAGSGMSRLNSDMTGSNPFLRNQMTGMPAVNYPPAQPQMSASTGFPGMGAGSTSTNPFGASGQQQQQQQQQQGQKQQNGQNQDLIQF